jgi:hypothetical protein
MLMASTQGVAVKMTNGGRDDFADGQAARGLEVIDAELRLIAMLRGYAHAEGRRPPSIEPADELLDERNAAVRGAPRLADAP